MLSPRHTWARIEGGKVTVGADDLAQKVLGPLDAVELPAVGALLRQGDPLMTLRHGGRTLTLGAPVAGRVAAVNEQLASSPRLVNDAPYGFGWAVVLEPDALSVSKKALRAGDAARAWLHAEIDRMVAALTSGAEPVQALPDGGQVVDNVHECIDDEAWLGIKQRFFGDVA
jgi:glycine cleavage system H protein